MKKLTKDQIAEKQRLLDALTEAKQKADDAIDELNTAREAARDFVNDRLSEMESYYDEKSEKWQEGDNGQQYGSWKDQWEEVANQLDEEVQPLDEIREAIEAFDNAAPDPESV